MDKHEQKKVVSISIHFEYKEKLEKMCSKEIDVDKVKKDTNKALNSFINSLKKEGENNE